MRTLKVCLIIVLSFFSAYAQADAEKKMITCTINDVSFPCYVKLVSTRLGIPQYSNPWHGFENVKLDINALLEIDIFPINPTVVSRWPKREIIPGIVTYLYRGKFPNTEGNSENYYLVTSSSDNQVIDYDCLVVDDSDEIIENRRWCN